VIHGEGHFPSREIEIAIFMIRESVFIISCYSRKTGVIFFQCSEMKNFNNADPYNLIRIINRAGQHN